MKYIKNSYRKYSKIYNLIFLIISISFTIGLIISLSLNDNLIKDIHNYTLNYINNYNSNIISNIFYPVITYLLLFICSLTIIGIFVPFLTLFIENMSLGLIIGIILQNTGIKGLIFSIIYFLLTKTIYIIILIYITINLYKFIKELLHSINKKNNTSIYNIYSKIMLRTLFSIIFIRVVIRC